MFRSIMSVSILTLLSPLLSQAQQFTPPCISIQGSSTGRTFIELGMNEAADAEIAYCQYTALFAGRIQWHCQGPASKRSVYGRIASDSNCPGFGHQRLNDRDYSRIPSHSGLWTYKTLSSQASGKGSGATT